MISHLIHKFENIDQPTLASQIRSRSLNPINNAISALIKDITSLHGNFCSSALNAILGVMTQHIEMIINQSHLPVLIILGETHHSQTAIALETLLLTNASKYGIKRLFIEAPPSVKPSSFEFANKYKAFQAIAIASHIVDLDIHNFDNRLPRLSNERLIQINKELMKYEAEASVLICGHNHMWHINNLLKEKYSIISFNIQAQFKEVDHKVALEIIQYDNHSDHLYLYNQAAQIRPEDVVNISLDPVIESLTLKQLLLLIDNAMIDKEYCEASIT